MKLHKLLVANWYLLNPQEIEFRGNTSIIGANGAGKSALIDAIQAILFGGNQKLIHLNASSSERRSFRDMHSYCLGTFRPQEDDSIEQAFRERNECHTYIGLVFIDGKEYINLLLGIEARAAGNYFEVKVRAANKGPSPLLIDDLVIFEGDQRSSYRTRDLSVIKKTLELRGFDFTYFNSAKEYITEMCQLLGPQRSQDWINSDKLAESLSKSISLKEVTDVSGFVENFILEPRDVTVQSMISAKRRYQELADEVEKAHVKIQSLEPIQKSFSNALRAKQDATAIMWLGYEQAIQANDLALSDMKENFVDIVKNIRTSTAIIRDKKNEVDARNYDCRSLEAAIKSDNIQAQIDKAKADLVNVEANTSALNEKRNKLYSLTQKVIHAPLEKAGLGKYDKLPKAIAAEMGKSSLHQDLKRLDRDLSELPQWQQEISNIKGDLYQTQYTEKSRVDKKITELGYHIQEAKDGRPPISPKAQRVMEALHEAGIDAQPLCRLATITDKDWQPAIEGYLKANTDALIVPPEDDEKAFAIYRDMKHQHADIFGVPIVKTSYCERWLNKFDTDTAATLVESKNPLALAFLHRLLGRLKLVSTVREVKESKSAITKSGMTSNATSSTRNQLPKILKLVSDQTENIREWESQRDTLSKRSEELDNQLQSLAKVDNVLGNIVSYQEDTTETSSTFSFLYFKGEMEALERKKIALDELLAGLNTEHLEELNAKLGRAEEDHARASGEYDRLIESRAESRQNKINLRNDIEKTKKELSESAAQRQKVEASPFFDPQHADTKQIELEFATLLELHEKSLIRDRAAERLFSQAVENLKHYEEEVEQIITDEQARTLDACGRLSELVLAHIEAIKQYDLHTKQEKIKQAQLDISRYFRSDMAIRLRDAFSYMRDQFREINNALSKREFHNEVYKFIYKPIAEYKELIEFITKAADNEFIEQDDLFDTMPEKVREQIDLLLSDHSEAAERRNSISDYRRYYRYDVQVHDTKHDTITMLSKLLKTGSGGEKQSPFYVAIAASLASAWRTLRNPGKSFGMTLLDEAFNKLDEHNLMNAVKFMNDVGLQVIVAAPSDKEQTFKPVMDTVLYIVRDGRAVDIDVEFAKDKGRQILMNENPVLNPGLIAAKLAGLEEAKAS